MPSSKSSLEMSDQLASHEVQLQQLRREYEEELRATSRNNPQLMSKSKSSWSEYKEKEEFLLFEIMRYETYILTLRTKNAHDTWKKEEKKVANTAQYIHFTLHTNLFLMILSDSFQSQTSIMT